MRCADTDLTPHPTAAEGLADDEAALSADKQALSFLDSLLGKEKAVELSEEVSVRKLQDQVLESMQKGDKAEVARLEAKVREAQAAAKAEEAKIAKLEAEEAKEVISTRKSVRPCTCTCRNTRCVSYAGLGGGGARCEGEEREGGGGQSGGQGGTA